MDKQDKSRAGHYEIHGETIAKFEFFDHGFNPYSRYLDVDKVDLILRKRSGDKVKYIEVQVKFGRLYECKQGWEKANFDVTSWRFFKPDEFSGSQTGLYVAYVLHDPDGYKGDIFIFPAMKFDQLLSKAIRNNTKKGPRAKVYIAHCIHDDKWYLWKKWKFNDLDNSTVEDVTQYRRNFRMVS